MLFETCDVIGYWYRTSYEPSRMATNKIYNRNRRKDIPAS